MQIKRFSYQMEKDLGWHSCWGMEKEEVGSRTHW